jgi:hypothetical protein
VVASRRFGSTLLDWVRFGGGVACILAALWVFVDRAPTAYREFNANVRDNRWRGMLDRLVAPGDITGLDKAFQEAALATIPKDATYTIVPPPNPEVAERAYGMNSITQEGLVPFLRYLLLPARLTGSNAQYVLCYGCDTTPWDGRTTWLWRNDRGQLIGKVHG